MAKRINKNCQTSICIKSNRLSKYTPVKNKLTIRTIFRLNKIKVATKTACTFLKSTVGYANTIAANKAIGSKASQPCFISIENKEEEIIEPICCVFCPIKFKKKAEIEALILSKCG